MVAAEVVAQQNAAFSAQHRDDKEEVVCVFAGATSGIGARTLERMTTMFRSPTFYVLGRSSVLFAPQRKALEALNPECKIIFLEAQMSLIAGVDYVCSQIARDEKQVDYLYMSMGGLPMNGAEYTLEGLETNFAISYWCRLRLVNNLLPLLNQSPRGGRVLSVLNGGREKEINPQDLGLERTWSLLDVIKHNTCMTSLAFEHLARHNPDMTFIHSYPGPVETDNFRRIQAREGSSIFWRLYLFLIKTLVWFLRLFIGMNPKEAGERQTYHLTGKNAFGSGSWRVHKDSEPVAAEGVFKQYLETGFQEHTWAFTLSMWERALIVYTLVDDSQQ